MTDHHTEENRMKTETKPMIPLNPDTVIRIVCELTGIERFDLTSGARRKPIPEAKALIAYTLHEHGYRSYADIDRSIRPNPWDLPSHGTWITAANRLKHGDYGEYAERVSEIMKQARERDERKVAS